MGMNDKQKAESGEMQEMRDEDANTERTEGKIVSKSRQL